MRKIKCLSVTPCEHEYEHKMNIRDFKAIGEFGVIRSIETLYARCLVCGNDTSEIVGAGYVFLGGVDDDK